MNSLSAVTRMAAAHDARLDIARTAAGADLNRIQPGLANVAARLIETADANGLQPGQDSATQIRIASAIDRVAVRAQSHGLDPIQSTRTAHLDFMIQEAASARMPDKGALDPLQPHKHPLSSRSTLRAAKILKDRHGIDAHAIFDRASQEDMQAIASGQFSKISAEITSYAISKSLAFDPKTMATKVADSPLRADMRGYPASGVARGPRQLIQQPFGRKGAER